MDLLDHTNPEYLKFFQSVYYLDQLKQHFYFFHPLYNEYFVSNNQ